MFSQIWNLCFFANENIWISIKMSLMSVHQGPINNIPALVQIMAWCLPGDKPLSEPMLTQFTEGDLRCNMTLLVPYDLKSFVFWRYCLNMSNLYYKFPICCAMFPDFSDYWENVYLRNILTHCERQTIIWTDELHWAHIDIMASQITTTGLFDQPVYSGWQQTNHQSSTLLTLLRAIQLWPVNSRGPLMRKHVHAMTCSWWRRCWWRRGGGGDGCDFHKKDYKNKLNRMLLETMWLCKPSIDAWWAHGIM